MDKLNKLLKDVKIYPWLWYNDDFKTPTPMMKTAGTEPQKIIIPGFVRLKNN